MRPSTLAIWLDAARPKTLPLAVTSILSGSAVAASQGSLSWSISLMALVTALLLQILSNLANDYGDAIKGTDNATRIGPMRAIQSGHVSLTTMRRALMLNIGLTLLSGGSLIAIACQQPTDIISFLLLGVMAIVAAITYTVGNKPYGYRGLGDVSVLIFFGWLGVAGTYYLQVGHIDSLVILPATACGLLAVGVLNINNLRDIDNDRACGKHTLVVRLGPERGRQYHVILLAGAVACYSLFAALTLQAWLGWLFLASVPLLVRHGRDVYQATNANALRPMMGTMVRCALITNGLFMTGMLLV
ncbi:MULTISPECIES: 1,4-dihydroxy-2-naphthoate polyprenyltransferase [Salinivibrio]|uniref:1,4-dihydroxy-2-naphthoate octaprenyltransferase n=1 Tax=Salinivibrio siamensis TaxID=414286 RepID=A0ABX3KEY3_9GAMM|nr:MULTISPECIES: 1,4-dihydroxy-2-naphthoate polyprenyltransferase [Salinivibrio]KKA44718.1 1,4-dihydroxy-2-naphthoate octaprenyltransferase [Salinivibrio sp. KP-1]OOE87443.1 1,4-dihydroxy-2-naphthoate polyprenyltransferase [Salinivibrio siamensis]